MSHAADSIGVGVSLHVSALSLSRSRSLALALALSLSLSLSLPRRASTHTSLLMLHLSINMAEVYYMKRLLHISTSKAEVGIIVAYVSLMLLLVWDDLVLMKYLYFNVKRKLKGEERRRPATNEGKEDKEE